MITSRVVVMQQGYAKVCRYPSRVPELRHDALTGRLVLLAAARGARPHTTEPMAAGAASSSCAFCPGHEAETPPEIARTGPGAPGEPGWRVRVFPNLFPVVGGEQSGTGATGAHEVVALSPDHGRAFGALTHDEAAEVLGVLRDRAQANVASGHDHVQVLINHGRAAGASIAHPHAQLVALDFVPPAVSVATERFAAAASDLVLADLADALDRGQGVVIGDEVSAWCPTGSASPFEVRIAARGAGARFDEASDAHLLGVAVVLQDVLARFADVLNDPPYNVVVHTADTTEGGAYHWWVEVTPRTSVVAGFEMGTGVLVNSVNPEDAAEQIRRAR
jgi:UDPglucose--hexose-1-phosphate uridylyltransferase